MRYFLVDQIYDFDFRFVLVSSVSLIVSIFLKVSIRIVEYSNVELL